MSFQFAIDAYMHELEFDRLCSPHTISNYRRDLDSIAVIAKSQKIHGWQSVTTQDIQGILTEKMSEGISPRSIARHLSSLKGLYEFLNRTGLQEVQKSVKYMFPKIEDVIPKTMKPAEVSRLLAISKLNLIDYRDAAMFELMYSCGLRVSELVSLDTENVNLRKNHLMIEANDRNIMPLPIGKYAAMALRDWIKQRDNIICSPQENALFLSQWGNRISIRSVQSRFRKIGLKKNFGKNISPQILRNSFSKHLLDNSNDVAAVTLLLRNKHAQRHNTKNYDFSDILEEYKNKHPRAKN